MSESGTEKSKRWPGSWTLLRTAFLVLGVWLLVVLVRQVGLSTLWTNAHQVGWVFLATVALFGGVHFVRAVSWRLCLGEDARKLPLWPALGLWVAGEAVSNLSLAWSGEAFRAAATSSVIPVARCLSALVISRLIYSYASLLLIGVGFLLAAAWLPLAGAVRGGTVLAALLCLGLAALPLLAGRATARGLERLSQRLGRRRSALAARIQALLEALSHDLQAIFAQQRRTFVLLVSLSFLAALAGVAEVYLILRALGAPVSLAGTLLIEGFNKLLALFAFFVPGNIGIREGGTVLIFRPLDISAAMGVTLVLVRRARALAWVGVGSLLVLVEGLTPLLHAPQGKTEGRLRSAS